MKIIMRFGGSFAAGVVALALLAGACDEGPQAPGRARFSHPDHGLSFAPPEGWEKVKGEEGQMLALFAPASGSGEEEAQSLVVTAEDLPPGIGPDEYAASALAVMQLTRTGFVRHEGGPFRTETGFEAHRAVCSYKSGRLGLELKTLIVTAVRGATGYSLIFTSTEDVFERARGAYERAARSLDFE